MTAVRVYVATTEGPSEIQRIAEEAPEVRSVVCLDGTSEALPISAAYDAFVRKPTGIIERLFGHPVYRVDVSTRISNGRSWQLGLFIAHALKAAGRLAQRNEKADAAVWLTGTVNSEHKVDTVEHVADKLRHSAALFAELKAVGIPITAFVPKANTDQVAQALEGEGTVDLDGITVIPVDSADTVCRHLGLPRAGRYAAPPPGGRLGGRIAAAVAVLVLAAAGAAGYTWRGDLGSWLGLNGTPPPVVTPDANPVPQPSTPAQPVPAQPTAPQPANASSTEPQQTAAAPSAAPAPATPTIETPPATTTSDTPPATQTAPAAQATPPSASAPDHPAPVQPTPAVSTPAPKPTPPAEPAAPALSAKDLMLSAFEMRAPRGRNCAIAGFGNAPLAEVPVGTTDAGQISPSSAQGLCAVVYRVTNDFEKPVEVWMFAAPTGVRARFGATTSASDRRRLDPGASLQVELTLPRWVSEPLRHRIIIVASEKAEAAAFDSIDRGMAAIQASFDFARWADLRDRIVALGMTLVSTYHEITP